MVCLTIRGTQSYRRAAVAVAVLFSLLWGPTSQAEPHGSSGGIEFRARLRERGGTVRCGLFRKAGWLKAPLAKAAAKADSSTALCVFENVPPGVYAVSAFHDKNDNGKLDTNLLSIPSEDYGASNNARGTFGPPSFEDAKFSYRGGRARLEANLR